MLISKKRFRSVDHGAEHNRLRWICSLNNLGLYHVLLRQMLGGLCQSLLVKYGMSEAGSMGSAFHGFLTTASACLLTTALLIACYVLSPNSQQLIGQSIFVSISRTLTLIGEAGIVVPAYHHATLETKWFV